IVRSEAGGGQRTARRARRQIGCQLALGGNVAAPDAAALANPFVGGVDSSGQLVVRHDALRQVSAAAENHGASHHHDAAAAAGGVPLVRPAPTLAICSASIAFPPYLTMSTASPIAVAKPTASVPPWLLTQTPLSPRNIAPLYRRGSLRFFSLSRDRFANT